ncbi:MAG TPA: hypothetical protein PKA64_12490, partial [Myxococcota bacterium]|nr:hypothetical protein [Myxococcota bacterium]
MGDACVGEDSAGDSDGDGVCDDRDLCVGDDAVGDPDRDAMCSDVDPCPRARGFVDSDGDGSCDADDLCAGDDRTGDADADGRCGDRDVCPTGPDRGIDGDLGSALGVVVEDDTCGASGDFAASCGRTRWWQDGSGGPDLAYLWTAPHADRFVFEVSGGAWNSTLHLRRPDYCKATPPPQLACDDNSGPDQHGRAELTLAAGEQVFVVVDGVSVDYANSSVCGPFSLSVTCVDDDGDGVCDGIDPCPEDNPDDGDGDGICDSDDLCRGDNQTGDADGDRVCDDLDQCTGNDAFGDGNGDGFCELPDLCFGDDRVGDADADGLCDDTDLCFGDELRGDLDLDGICDDLDTCDGQYDFADFELELGSRRGRFGPFTTCGGSDTLSLGCNPRFEASGEDLVMRWAPPFADDWTFRLVPVSGIVPMLEVRGAEVCPPWSVCDLDPVGSPQLVESLDPDGPYYRSEVWVIAGGYDDLCGTFELDILCTDDDGDDVCNRFDVCAGDDRRGDADGDGFCDDVDLCLGDDATGDSDHDRICDALDACLGDDRSGDADADGYCALDAAGRVLDCGPDDPSAYPGSTSLDVCDGVDQQCDGVATDEAGADLDGDGRCDEIDDDRDGDGCPDVADDDPDVVGDPAAAPSPDLTTEAHVAGSITGGAWTVAVDGDRAIVGAPSAGAAGRISAFEHGPAGWTEVLSLASPGPVGFGRAVDISGDVAVVGAVGATNAPGEVWVLSRGAGGAWGMTTMLSRAGLVDYGRFGQAVSVSGGRIAVGAREAVHLFARAPDRSWSVEDSLDNHLDAWSGDTGISLPANTYYGAAVSLDGDRLAVGAPGSPGDPSTSPTFDIAGAVFVYERGEGGAWRFDYAVPSGPSPALGVSARYLGNRVDLRGDDLITQYGELAESGRRSTVRQYRYDGAAWAFVREISGPRQVGDGLALDDRYAWVRDGETGQILAVDLRSGAVDEAVTPAPTTQGAYGDLAIDAGRLLTVGSDLTDAAMVAWESGRPLYDGDANGLPDDCELCLAQGDADGDRVCDAQDPCPLDAPDDSDGDAVCDSDDQCVGDDLAGDSDGDGVCDDRDVCWGDDALGDGDGDGVCSDLDACFGDDALGDGDGDGVCADLDACAGDDRRGDLDGDGVCDDRDACVGDDAVGDA